tara:strand:+ start:68 stop:667 length:600 start_codon:yes stop_codon:yes gene_type:complete
MKKTCGTCKNEYPKTTEYFFIRKIKQCNSKGELKIYNSFRSDCKKCKAEKGNKRRIKKRCKEMNCCVSDYRKNWKKQYTETRTFDLIAKNELTPSEYNWYLVLFKKGLVSNAKEYKEKVFINKHSKPWLRKADYKGKVFLEKKESQDKSNKHKIENITDTYIVNNLGYKKGEVPKEIIETKRLLIKLKRELNTTNYERQ